MPFSIHNLVTIIDFVFFLWPAYPAIFVANICRTKRGCNLFCRVLFHFFFIILRLYSRSTSRFDQKSDRELNSKVTDASTRVSRLISEMVSTLTCK